MTHESALLDNTPAHTAPTVFLHIGTMKTGTSFLQHVLQRNAAVLAGEGVLYPLTDSGAWAMQVRATRDVLGIGGRPSDGGWAALLERIQTWTGRAAVVSMEFYSLANDATVRQVAERLAPSPVQVIVTARDLARIMPSAWQSMIKQGHQWSFPDFVAEVTGSGGPEHDAHRRFWLHHDLPGIVGRWADAVGAQNVHLVTVPPSGAPPTVLWERFSSVIGVTPNRYDISQDRRSNFSLSYSDTEFMRQVNEALQPHLDRVAFKRWATRYFANRVLRASAGARTADDRPVLSAETQRWAVQRSHEMVDAIEAIGVRVVGDLADLIPVPADAPDSEEAVEPQRRYPDRAVLIVSALLRRLATVDPHLSGGVSTTDQAGDDIDDPEGHEDLDDDLGQLEKEPAAADR